MTVLDTAVDRFVVRLRARHGGSALTCDNASPRPDHIENTVVVQRGLTVDIGWGLTSGVRPACLGRRVAATAIGREDE